MSPTQFRISVEFLSDWHIGAGASRQGYVDRLVRRDPVDRLPYVPAKTLTGMLRDACEDAARALDGPTAPARWTDLMIQLFGDEPAKRSESQPVAPISALLSIRPARLRGDLREWLRFSRQLAEALTFVKPGIAIDERTGQSKGKYLRMEEMVRGGMVLTADAEVSLDPLPPESHDAARALLWASTRIVERLGGKRRRGAGRCRLQVEQKQQGSWRRLDDEQERFLKTLQEPAVWSCARVRGGDTTIPHAMAATGDWIGVPLDIQLCDPVVVPHRVSGNSVETFDFIPGTMLLAPVLERLRVVFGQPAFPFVARGDIRVLNAYIVVDGDRGRPVPFSIEHEKHDGGLKDGSPAWNALIPADIPPRGSEARQPKQHREGYVGAMVNNLRPRLQQPELIQITHNTINDNRQRPIELEVGIYTYQAIAPGTMLRSELHLRRDLAQGLPADWTSRLAGPIKLGIAKKDDYARAELSAGKLSNCPGASVTDKEITVWLLSDVLLRGLSLEPVATIGDLERVLAEELQVGLKRKDDNPYRLRTRRVEGWQTRWNLPRPSLIGIEAGSVARFVVDNPPTDLGDRLTALVHRGIGERRGEGYGELAINDPIVITPLRKLKCVAMPDDPPDPPEPNRRLEATDDVKLIECEAWLAEIRRRVPAWAANPAERRKLLKWKGRDSTKKQQSEPSNSQLGRLRAHALNLANDDGPARLTEWLSTAERRKKWPSTAGDALKKALVRGSDDERKAIAAILGITTPVSSWGDLWNEFPAPTEDAVARLSGELWGTLWKSALLGAIHAEQRDREKERGQ